MNRSSSICFGGTTATGLPAAFDAEALSVRNLKMKGKPTMALRWASEQNTNTVEEITTRSIVFRRPLRHMRVSFCVATYVS